MLGQIAQGLWRDAGLEAREQQTGAQEPVALLLDERLGTRGVEAGQRFEAVQGPVVPGIGQHGHHGQRDLIAGPGLVLEGGQDHRQLVAERLARAEEFLGTRLRQRQALGRSQRCGQVAGHRMQAEQGFDVGIGQGGGQLGAARLAIGCGLHAHGEVQLQRPAHRGYGRIGGTQPAVERHRGDVAVPLGVAAAGAAHVPFKGDQPVRLGQAGIGPERVAHEGHAQQRQRNAQREAEDDDRRLARSAAQLAGGEAGVGEKCGGLHGVSQCKTWARLAALRASIGSSTWRGPDVPAVRI